MLLEPIFRHCHQVRCVGTLIPISKGQIGEDLPGVLYRNFSQNERICHSGIIVPIVCEAVDGFSALHLAQDFLIPVQIIVLGFFLALAGQFLQNRLSVLNRSGEHLLPVLLYRFEVKFIAVRIMLRVGVHYQTFQQRFIIRLDKYGNKALPYPQPLGVAVCRHDGVIICHGWEIGTLAVQILHDGMSHFGRLQRVLVEVLSLPVFKAFLNHLSHGLIVFLIKWDE